MFYVLLCGYPLSTEGGHLSGGVYNRAGVLGVCSVLQVIVELVFCNVRARIVFYMLICG